MPGCVPTSTSALCEADAFSGPRSPRASGTVAQLLFPTIWSAAYRVDGYEAMLSHEEVELYRRRRLFAGPAAVVARRGGALRNDCLRTCAKPIELGDQNPYSLKRHASNRVKPYLLFPWAAELVRHPRILDLVEDVIGPDISCFTPRRG